jgi:hypothetical protein
MGASARGLGIWDRNMKVPVFTHGPSGLVLRCTQWAGVLWSFFFFFFLYLDSCIKVLSVAHHPMNLDFDLIKLVFF